MATGQPGTKAGDDYSVALTKGVRGAVAKAMPELTAARLDAFLAELFGIADSTLARLVAKDPPRRQVACKEGCAYCCHLYVQVTPLEAVRIARSILARGAEAAAIAREHVAAAYKRTAGKDALDRNLLAVPCPLLQDGRCSVYGERPFEIGRAHV